MTKWYISAYARRARGAVNEYAMDPTPQEVDFLNERIRPRAEQIRALNALIKDDLAQWDDLAMTTGSDDIADGGKPFTRDDAHSFKAKLTALFTTLDSPAAVAIVQKACVRSLRVTFGE